MVHCYVERVSDETRRESIGQVSDCRLCLISNHSLNVSDQLSQLFLCQKYSILLGPQPTCKAGKPFINIKPE